MFKFWLAWRYFFAKQNLKLTTKLGVLGLGLGVGSLMVSMAVVSGYEATLKNNLIDMVGHVLIVKKHAQEQQWMNFGLT